jgi:hypothetical protein
MNRYSILSNELTTKKIIYATVILAHILIALLCLCIEVRFSFILPSLSLATIFFIAFTLLERKAKRDNMRFLFYFYNFERQKKELFSNFKYLLLITLLIYFILLFTSLVLFNLNISDKNYPLFILLSVLLLYGIFEFYRFTITQIMCLITINKACNKSKELKETTMLRLGVKYENLENFFYNLNYDSFYEPEIYSLCNSQLIISLQNSYVFTPKKIPINMFISYLKENDMGIEALTKEDILIIEMLSC